MADNKIEFQKWLWLSAGNTLRYSPVVCIANLDEVSEYAIRKNITDVNLFEITSSLEFNNILNKLLKNKIFKITKGTAFKTFEKTGEIYTQFLKEREKSKISLIKKLEMENTVKKSPDVFLPQIVSGFASINQITDITKCQQDEAIIDWDKPLSLKNTKPIKMKFRTIETTPRAWNSLLVDVCGALIKSFPNKDIKGYKWWGTTNSLFENNWNGTKWQKEVTSGLYVHTLFSSDDTLKLIRGLFKHYGIDILELKITVVQNSIIKYNKEAKFDNYNEQTKGATLLEWEERVLLLFKDRFELGMRLQYVDLQKLKFEYNNEFSEDLEASEDEIKKLILNHGFETESNKFFHLDNLLCKVSIEEIEGLIEKQSSLGVKRIWIEPLYDHFKNSLSHAVNSDLLINILQKIKKDKYKKDKICPFIYRNGAFLVGQNEEICQVVANLLEIEGTHLDLDKIQEKLPVYPSLARKKGLLLTQSPHIVSFQNGSYLHINCVYITDAELSKAKQIIEGALATANFMLWDGFLEEIKKQLISVFENNDSVNEAGILKALTAKLSLAFDFSPTGMISRNMGEK